MIEFNVGEIFNEPKVVAICANANEGKSNLLYHLLKKLSELDVVPSIYCFGFRVELAYANQINSIGQLEQIKNSVIFIDEFIDLFDLDDRKKKAGIERTLRLIYHNNNVLVLSGLPENFKKFIASKVHLFIYKRVTFSDFINGSRIKNVINDYEGILKGNSLLNLEKGEALLFNGAEYNEMTIPYLEDFDTKRNNVAIVRENVS